MGEYADLAIERELECSYEEKLVLTGLRQKSKPNYTMWTTKNEGIVEIKNMSTTHIKNALSQCMRYEWRIAYIPALKKELKKRGEKW